MTIPHENSLIDLLYRLADDELLIGHRHSEWTGVAPILEEDIAFSSLAQDEMGHAQAYYALLHEAFGQDNPDTLAFMRDASQFKNAALTALPRQDWADAILRQCLYDCAEQVRMENYVNHPFTPLAALARKFWGEEKYHFLHARTWILKLGNGTEDSRARLQAALDFLWPYGLGLFEPSPPETQDYFDENKLCHQWLQLVCPLLIEAGLTVDAMQEQDGRWITQTQPIYGRYAPDDEHRQALVDSLQKVYRIDPSAQW